MSTIKADAITASTGINTNIALTGKGSGKVAIGDGTLLFPDADGSTGQYIKTDGSANLAFATLPTAGFTLGTVVATTSGTTAAFTGIPSGVKRIIISCAGVSTNGTSDYLVRIGDSGGLETSSYSATSAFIDGAFVTSTAGFIYNTGGSAAFLLRGTFELSLLNSSTNAWVCSSNLGESGADVIALGQGFKLLSGELTQLDVTTVSGDTFDAGSINIIYQ